MFKKLHFASGLAFLVTCLTVFSQGCFRTPTPPSWDSELNIPIAGKIISMSDICDSATDSSIAILNESYNIDTMYARDFLKLDSITYDSVITFNDIMIKSIYSGQTRFTLGELGPALGAYQGTVIDTTIATIPFQTSHNLLLNQNFTEATVESGYVVFSITDSFPIDIESLQVLVLLPDTLVFEFNGLTVGETRRDSNSISGKTIKDSATCELKGKTASGDSILIDTSNALVAEVGVYLHTLNSMVGKFPSDTVEMKTPVPLAPYKLYIANIDSGYFNFNLFSAIKNDFDFRLEGTECNFLPFTCPIQRGANDSTMQLDNVSIIPSQPDTLRLMGYILPPPSPGIDTLDNSDTFSLKIKFSNLYLSFLSGYLDTAITSAITERGQKVDYGGFDPTGIEFQEASLYLKLWSTIDASPELSIRLLGMRDVQRESLYLQIPIHSGENDTIISGDSVVNFLNLFPESINVSGEVALTGNVNVKAEDYICGEFGIEVPLDFTLSDTLVFEPESMRIEIPDEIQKTEIVDTRLLLWYDNTLPLKGDLSLCLSTDSTVYGDTMLHVDIQKGIYRYNEAVDIQKYLKEKTIWGRLLVRFYPDTVSALITDKFNVKTLLKVKLTVEQQ